MDRWRATPGDWIASALAVAEGFARWLAGGGPPPPHGGADADAAPPADDREALRRSEERFRVLVRAAAAIVWTADPAGRFVEPQPSWEAYTGYPWERYRGFGWLDAIHPDDRARVRAAWEARDPRRDVAATARVWHAASGTWRCCEGRVVALREADGRVREWVGMGADVEDRVRARAERDLLGAIVEASPDLMGVVRDGRVLHANRAGREILGLGDVDVRGRSVYEYLTPAAAEVVRAVVLPAVRARGSWRGTVEFRHARTGEAIPMQFDVFHVEGGDVAAVGHDLREERRMREALARSEERLVLAQEAAHVGVFDWDMATGAVLWTPEQERLFGLAPGTFGGTFDDWAALVDAADVAAVRAQVEAAARARESRVDFQFRVRRADGAARTMTGWARFVYDDAGRPLRLVGAVMDVTEQVAAVAEREALLREAERARRDAEAASRAKDEFLAVLSHELRAPLHASLGWVSLLRRGTLPAEKTVEAAQRIERNIRVQTQLVNDLLDVSRIVSGKLVIDRVPVDLAVVVEEALAGARASAEAERVALVADLAPVAAPVIGDAARLLQVMTNLLGNAIKFTPAGGRVTVRLRRDADVAAIEVEDTGPGIPPQFLPHLFDRFAQADASTTRRHGGLGLGLSIARHLVLEHGGTIDVGSRGPGRGARFTVRLPLDPARAHLDAAPPRRRVAAPAALEGACVLLVEDEADTRDALAVALGEAGARVVVAASARAALAAVEREVPAVVVSDIGMPEEDGYWLIAHLRERPALHDVPAVAMTGFASREDELRALQAGFSHHLAKPVEPDALVALLADVVAARAVERGDDDGRDLPGGRAGDGARG